MGFFENWDKSPQKKWDKGDIFFSLLVWVGFVKIKTSNIADV